ARGARTWFCAPIRTGSPRSCALSWPANEAGPGERLDVEPAGVRRTVVVPAAFPAGSAGGRLLVGDASPPPGFSAVQQLRSAGAGFGETPQLVAARPTGVAGGVAADVGDRVGGADFRAARAAQPRHRDAGHRRFAVDEGHR